MLAISLIIYLCAVPLSSYYITPNQFNRITSIILIFAAYLTYNSTFISTEWIDTNSILTIFNIFQVSPITTAFDIVIIITAGIILAGYVNPTISEYYIIVLFTVIGASILISSYSLISLFLAIELQSFGVYILATIFRSSESATAAGLKYFLLGGLSSTFILLGSAIIYSYSGLTQLNDLYILISVPNDSFTIDYAIIFGILFIGCGILFKVASSPFHHWAPDVYDGVPTVVTMWLSIIPKISLFIFFLTISTGMQGSYEALSIIVNGVSYNVWSNLLLIGSLLSLITRNYYRTITSTY